MKIISAKKHSGKTTQLVILAARTGDYIVTRDHETAKLTMEIARKMNLRIDFPITYGEFMSHGWHGRGISGFLIDDLDFFLEMLFSHEVPVHAVTITTNGDEEVISHQ